MPRPSSPLPFIDAFLRHESASGLVLMAMAVVALGLANSPLAEGWQGLLHAPLGPLKVEHWINDGLMAVFFLLVALEIKREMMEGELASAAKVAAPAVAALGGMLAPAAVYLAFTLPHPHLARGWAIPSATDIAFSLGVLSLLAGRAPPSLKVFLAALAIIDDLGAIVIIALAYAGGLSGPWLAAALAVTVALAAINRLGVASPIPYLALGAALWVCVLNSGVHATVAGVVTGMAVPLATAKRLEQALHPAVAFAILPLFALANAGLSFAGMNADSLARPVFLGVALGLFLGKQAGVLGFTWALVRLGLARLPEGAGWRQFHGMAVLTGIGFTMSLFMGGLAFPGNGRMDEVRAGVLAGSLASALVGWALLAWSSKRTDP